MKKLILALSLLSQLYIQAQKKIDIYVPLRTFHYQRNTETMRDYYKTEGGDIGLILKVDNISAGAFRNSYGDTSFTLMYGLQFKTSKNINSSFNFGIATGYEKFYSESKIGHKFPKILKTNGLLPTALISISYSKFKLQPTIVISPTFINAGITYQIYDSTKLRN